MPYAFGVHVVDSKIEEEIKMADEKKIETVPANTPVSEELLLKLQQLQQSRLHISDQLLDIELTRVKLLAGAQRLDNEKLRTFEGILLERGLPLNTVVEIDGGTGAVRFPNAQPTAEAEPTP